MKKFLKLSLILVVTVQLNVFAQEDAATTDGEMAPDSLQDFTTVMYAGIAGTVLGLSTISFENCFCVSEHSDRLQMGAAVGIIIGVIAIGAQQADRSKQFFTTGEEGQEQAMMIRDTKDFSTAARYGWATQVPYPNQIQAPPLTVGHSWEF